MKARFVDKQEEAAVRRIIEKLAPKHPLRTAFDEGADTVQLIMVSKDMELRHLLRGTVTGEATPGENGSYVGGENRRGISGILTLSLSA